jgi:hypothetical protein
MVFFLEKRNKEGDRHVPTPSLHTQHQEKKNEEG